MFRVSLKLLLFFFEFLLPLKWFKVSRLDALKYSMLDDVDSLILVLGEILSNTSPERVPLPLI